MNKKLTKNDYHYLLHLVLSKIEKCGRFDENMAPSVDLYTLENVLKTKLATTLRNLRPVDFED